MLISVKVRCWIISRQSKALAAVAVDSHGIFLPFGGSLSPYISLGGRKKNKSGEIKSRQRFTKTASKFKRLILSQFVYPYPHPMLARNSTAPSASFYYYCYFFAGKAPCLVETLFHRAISLQHWKDKGTIRTTTLVGLTPILSRAWHVLLHLCFGSRETGLAFTKPSELLTLTSSLRPAAAHTTDIKTIVQLSCFTSKQTGQSEIQRWPVSC